MELVVTSLIGKHSSIRLTDSFLLLEVQYEQEAFLVNLFDGESHQFSVLNYEDSPVEAWYVKDDDKYQVEVDVIKFIERNEFVYSKEETGGDRYSITVSSALFTKESA